MKMMRQDRPALNQACYLGRVVHNSSAGPQYNEPENAMFRYNPRVACVHYDGLEALGALGMAAIMRCGSC